MLRFSFSSIFNLGSVPGSPEEVRAFQQRRLAWFVGGACVLWLAGTALGLLLSASADLSVELTPQGGIRAFWLHVGVASALAALFAFLRVGARGATALSLADAAATLLLGSELAMLVRDAPAEYRPELFMVLSITHILLLRTCFVPSAASRTAVLGALAFAPIVYATHEMYARLPRTPSGQPALGYTLAVAIWALIAIVVTALVSRVQFGLQDAVRRARRLGQYTLGERIGQGGMGVVFKAEHALLRRPTAVKLLPPERAGATALSRFEREVQITSQLTHPNTIAVYDYGRTPDGVFYYAMEYLEGCDLAELVRLDGPQPAGRVVHFLRQAAGSLAEAHANGLIHRDIKPSNLLLCRRGHDADFVKVLDFGLVRELESEAPGVTQGDQLAGTPSYMSPEQIADPALVDARSDLYSLACVAYELLAGAPPFQGKSVVAVCSQHLHTEPIAPSITLGKPIPAALEALVLRCLAKKREERPADANLFTELLDACEGLPTWTQVDAVRWWDSRSEGILARRKTERPQSVPALTVDVAERRASA